MAIAWPEGLCPSEMTWGVVYNNRAFTSTLSNAQQIVGYPGAYWQCQLTFSALSREEERILTAFIGRLQGMFNTFNLPAFTRISETSLKGCRGRNAKLLFVVINQAGEYAADILFSGRMDAAQFAYSGNGSDGNAIRVPIIDRMAEWSRIATERWTDENHRARYQGDRFFFAVAQMADWPIYWGASKDAPSFSYE